MTDGRCRACHGILFEPLRIAGEPAKQCVRCGLLAMMGLPTPVAADKATPSPAQDATDERTDR